MVLVTPDSGEWSCLPWRNHEPNRRNTPRHMAAKNQSCKSRKGKQDETAKKVFFPHKLDKEGGILRVSVLTRANLSCLGRRKGLRETFPHQLPLPQQPQSEPVEILFCHMSRLVQSVRNCWSPDDNLQ